MKTDNKIVEIYRNNPHVSIQFLGNATMIRKSSEQETEFFTYTYQPKDSTIAVQENEALMKIVKYSADSLTLSMKKDKQEVIFIYAKHQYEK